MTRLLDAQNISVSYGKVEAVRNVPLLLQLFMWYFVLTEMLPPIEEALHPLPGIFFSKNGLQFPHPEWSPGHWGTLAGFVVDRHGALKVLLGGIGLLSIAALGFFPATKLGMAALTAAISRPAILSEVSWNS